MVYFALNLDLAQAKVLFCERLLNMGPSLNALDQLLTSAAADSIAEKLRPQATQIVQERYTHIDGLKMFFHYLKLRKENLPRELSEKFEETFLELGAWNVLTYRPQTQYPTDRVTTIVNGWAIGTEHVHVELPKPFHESALGYAILIHEYEHIIQNLADPEASLSPRSLKFNSHLFYSEQGAMRAEAAFLMSFPKEYLLKLQNEVQVSFRLDAETKNFLSQVLDAAMESESVQEYVQSQWNLGRYSRKQILDIQLRYMGIK